jgi:hypothetical protein
MFSKPLKRKNDRFSSTISFLFEFFFGFPSVETGHCLIALRLSQASVVVELQPRFLCLFRVVACFSRFGSCRGVAGRSVRHRQSVTIWCGCPAHVLRNPMGCDDDDSKSSSRKSTGKRPRFLDNPIRCSILLVLAV